MKNQWKRLLMLAALLLCGCSAGAGDTGAQQQEEGYTCTYEEGARFSLQVGQQVCLIRDDGEKRYVQVDEQYDIVSCSVRDTLETDTSAYSMGVGVQVRDLYLCCEGGDFVIACVQEEQSQTKIGDLELVEVDIETGEADASTLKTVFWSPYTLEMETVDGIFWPEQEAFGTVSNPYLGVRTFGGVSFLESEEASDDTGSLTMQYVTNCPLVICLGDEQAYLAASDFLSENGTYRIVPAGTVVTVRSSADLMITAAAYGDGTGNLEFATAYNVSVYDEYGGYILVDEDGKLLFQGMSARQALGTGFGQQMVRQDYAMTGQTISTLLDETLTEKNRGVTLYYYMDDDSENAAILGDASNASNTNLYVAAPEEAQSVRVQYLYAKGPEWIIYVVTWKDGDGQETSTFYTPFYGILVPMQLCEQTEDGFLTHMDGAVTLPKEPVITQEGVGILQGDQLGQYTRMGANLLVRVQ